MDDTRSGDNAERDILMALEARLMSFDNFQHSAENMMSQPWRDTSLESSLLGILNTVSELNEASKHFEAAEVSFHCS